jgi:hypothetical protein
MASAPIPSAVRHRAPKFCGSCRWSRIRTRLSFLALNLSGNDFKLPKNDLSRRNQNIKQLLSEIAQQAKLRSMAFLIVARDDKEGRWIYGEMRKSVPGYRLRGNIERGSEPRISFERELLGM